jgi:hypothetical protein
MSGAFDEVYGQLPCALSGVLASRAQSPQDVAGRYRAASIVLTVIAMRMRLLSYLSVDLMPITESD